MRLTPECFPRAIVIVLLAISSPAHAADDAEPRWQFTLAADANQFDGDHGNYFGVPYDFRGDTLGWRVEGALRVWGPLWLEAGYRDMGSFQAEFAYCDFTGYPPVPPICVPALSDISTHAYSINARAEMGLGGAWRGFLRYGWFEYTREIPGWGFDDSGPVAGLGIVYGLGDRYAITLAWESYRDMVAVDSRPDSTASLGLRITL